jgi:hypothetical protein
MAECIVCKGHYDPKTKECTCDRCGASNAAWEAWQKQERHRGPIRNLLDFVRPVGFAPLLPIPLGVLLVLAEMLSPQNHGLIIWSFARPLQFAPLRSVPLGVLSVLAMVVFPQNSGLIAWSAIVACLSATVSVAIAMRVYSQRFEFHEAQLLRNAEGRSASVNTAILLAPAGVLILAVLLTTVLLEVGIPQFTQTAHRAYVARVLLPVVLADRISQLAQEPMLVAYLAVVATLAPLAMGSATNAYSRRLSQALPQPIFLQPTGLAELVKRETATALGGPGANLQWGVMERTPQSGIKLYASRKLDSKVVEDLKGKTTKLPVIVKYEIEADRWGRLIAIREMKG